MDVGATVDAGGPTTVKSIESFAAIVEQVSAAKATAAWPLQADKVLVDSDKGPQLFEPSLSVDTTLTGKIGKVRDAVVFNGEVMVAGESGLFSVAKDELLLSPISKALGGVEIVDLQVTPGAKGESLWLATDEGLRVYRDGKLHKVSLAAGTVVGGQLAWGGTVDGEPGLWVGLPTQVSAVVVVGSKVTSWLELGQASVEDLACDAQGTVWVVSKGELLERTAPGQWRTWLLPSAVVSVAGASSHVGLWLRTTKRWWRHTPAGFFVVDGGPKAGTLEIDDQGNALIANSQGVHRLRTKAPPVKPKVSWSKDISPIYIKSCSLCHSDEGSAVTKLYNAKFWQDKYDKILKNVVSGAMPLKPVDPLSPAQIAVIKAWASDGYLE